jgi:hypothetical protein
MDWMERIFNLAPDGGNGRAEVAILLAIACVAMAGVRLLRHRVQTEEGDD